MSFRTVVISNRSKLDLKMGYLVVRSCESAKRVFLDEINVLMIENPACAVTGCLLEELVRRKIKVIFCDSKHLPSAELLPFYGTADNSRRLREQIGWSPEFCLELWTLVIVHKIRYQAELLRRKGLSKQAEMLSGYAEQIRTGDPSNREGHAAKVYFNALFGEGFSRQTATPVNSALDYGYTIVMSAFSREISACGYLTQLGFGHHNTFNSFNLASDLMEPFRILVDDFVLQNNFRKFETEEKHAMVRILQQNISIDHASQTMINAIHIYVCSVFRAIREHSLDEIRFFTL